jgi:ferrochelatase
MTTYDAILLLSFGGPEGPDDVMPFLENVTRGRNVPRERLAEVAEHYLHFGGKSPINDQNRALIAALEIELAAHGPKLPIYWGNRNWAPYLADTLRAMRDEGVSRALCFATSAYGSYSGCRQYREDIARAREAIGDGAPEVLLLRKFFDHPGFVGPNVERVKAALATLPDAARASARLVFTAHSVPQSMADSSPYVAQLEETARLVADGVGRDRYDLVWQSRSGAPQIPWLEPDVRDHLRALAADGASGVVVSPIGFISDHMEVLYDLDHEARAVADELGLLMARAGTVGTHPGFITMIRELVAERVLGAARRKLGSLPIAPDVCRADCCAPPRRA